MHMPEPLFLRATPSAVGAFPHTYGPGAGPRNTSLDEERREIAATVLGALAGNAHDPDEMAACIYLLKHLSQSAGRHSA